MTMTRGIDFCLARASQMECGMIDMVNGGPWNELSKECIRADLIHNDYILLALSKKQSYMYSIGAIK